MKVLIVTQTFPLTPTDSTAHFMYDFAKGLQRTKNTVRVLLPFHPELLIKEFKDITIRVYKYLPFNKLHLIGYGRTLKNDQNIRWYIYLLAPFYIISSCYHLYKLTQSFKPDVIHAHWLIPNGFICAVISLLTHTPYIVTLPGSDVYISKKNFFFKLIAQFALKNAHAVTSNSPLLLQDLDIKGDVISYGVPMNLAKRPVHNNVRIISAGRLVEKKGFGQLKKIIPNIEIISDLPSNIFRKRLLSTDIFIALSMRDDTGNLDDASLVILEAMAAGCTVITTNLPGNRTIITDKKNGILLSLNHLSQLKGILTYLKTHRSIRVQLGIQARQTIKTRFTPEKIARRYMNIYQRIVENKDGRLSL